MLKNLFVNLPNDKSREAFDDLLNVPGLRIERIVSYGQQSPTNFWYEQEDDEWVIVLQGLATLEIENETNLVTLKPGDHYWIPASLRHRVNSTAPDGATIWLAVHRPPSI